MGLYEHMPDGMREVVDEIVDILQPEPWPDRFRALYGLLCDKMEEPGRRDPHHLLQEWAGIVTAVLEKLPPDSSIAECLALMSISFNDQWRAEAIARMDREPNVFDRLCSAYPDWGDIVEDLVEADRRRPVKRSHRHP